MSGARILFPEFRDEQSDSRYPFADTATLTANTGFAINRTTFIDASLYPINAQSGVYISEIVVDADIVVISISDSAGTSLCSGQYNPLTAPEDGVLQLSDTYGRPAGLLLSTQTDLALFGGWDVGPHVFDQEATEFVASVVIPAQEPGVRGLLLPGGELLTGDVWLIGDQGVVLRQTSPGVIRVDVVGEPLFRRLQCLADDGTPKSAFSPKDFLRTINGCGPDEFGNFNITVATKSGPDSVLRVYPENDVLRIEAVGSRVL
jgi:hypothetical protein